MSAVGRTEVTAAGTPEALDPDHDYRGMIVVQALSDNVGYIAIGPTSGVNPNIGNEAGTLLAAGEVYSIPYPPPHSPVARPSTQTVFIDCETGNDGDGVSWTVWE